MIAINGDLLYTTRAALPHLLTAAAVFRGLADVVNIQVARETTGLDARQGWNGAKIFACSSALPGASHGGDGPPLARLRPIGVRAVKLA
jgi:hypothetical protein